MAQKRIHGGSEIPLVLENENISRSSDLLPLWSTPNSSSPFQAKFINVGNSDENNEQDDFDGFWRQSGKKRRLTADQVRSLEKSFEKENKLEPDRKIQLARELHLQPRQVAIWFQNRRARCKNKQLEKDYSSLKSVYEKVKSEYEALVKDNEKLKVEFEMMKEKVVMREKEGMNSEKRSSEEGSLSSGKSVVFDSEKQGAMAEAAASSELSQDEEENLSRNLLPACFPKLEECYYDEPPPSCCNFGFQIEDQPLGFWPC